MPDINMVTVGLDASKLRTGVDEVSRLLSQIGKEFKSIIAIATQQNDVGVTTGATFRAVKDTATELIATITTLKDGTLDYSSATRMQNTELKRTKDLQNDLVENTKLLNREQRQVTKGFQAVMSKAVEPTQETSIGAVSAFAKAQQRLQASILEAVQAGELPSNLKTLMNKLAKGDPVVQQTPALERLQDAMLGILRSNERITEEKRKQDKLSDAEERRSRIGRGAIGRAERFILKEDLGTQPEDTASILATQRSAQTQLIRGLIQVRKEGGGRFDMDSMLKDVRNKLITEEVGGAAQIQAALIRFVQLEERRAAVRERILRMSDKEVENAAKQSQITESRRFRQDVQRELPIPAGTTPAQLANYQRQLAGLQRAATQTNLPESQLSNFFRQVRADPGADLSKGNEQLFALQTAINRTIAAYQQLGKTGTEAGDRMGVSLARLTTILEIQLVHRIFGGFITEIQQSIGRAADLQRQIAEIASAGRNVGATFGIVEAQVRSLSDTFGLPQADIATASYAAYSSQLVRTAGDQTILTEALRFSRATMTTATESVRLGTTALRAFGLSSVDAARTYETLATASRLAGTQASEMTHALNTTGIAARQLGISLEEVSGFVITLAQRGETASQASSQLHAIMQSLLRPSQELQRWFQRLGATSGIEFVRMSGGLRGAIRVMIEEINNGNISLQEMSHNLRSMEGVMGSASNMTQNMARNIAAVSQLGGIDDAMTAITQTAGDRFRVELNKIQNYFTSEFGNAIIIAINKMAAPFGGISGLLKQVGEAVLQVVQITLNFGLAVSTVISWFEKWGITISRVVQGYLIYRATLIGINIVQGLHTQITQQSTNAIVANALGTNAATTATTSFSFSLVDATAKTTLLTRAQESAAFAASAFKTALSAAFVGFAIAQVIHSIAEYIRTIDRASDRTREFRNQLSQLQRNRENEIARTNTVESRENYAFAEDIRSRQDILLEANRANYAGFVQLRDRQKELNRQTTENLRASIRGVEEEMSAIIGRIRRQISEAYTAIDTSRRRITSFRDRDATELFRSTLSYAAQTGRIERSNVPQSLAQSGLSDEQYQQIHERLVQIREDAGAAQNAFELENRLISGRISQLIREANRLYQTGNREDIESARRKFAEAQSLTQQQFDLQQRNNRAQMQAGLQIRAIESGQAQRGTLQVNIRELDRARANITAQEQAGEERSQVVQNQRLADARVMNNLESQRQQRILDTGRALQAFSITDREGNLEQRFRGPRGIETAQREYDRLAAAYQRALSPIQLSAQEIENLVARVGQYQAGQIQDALRRGQLSAQQRIQLEGSVTQDRVRQIAAQLAEHRISAAQILEVEEATQARRIQMIRELRREQDIAETQAVERRIRTAGEVIQAGRTQAQQQRAMAQETIAGQAQTAINTIGQIQASLVQNAQTLFPQAGILARRQQIADVITEVNRLSDAASGAVREFNELRQNPTATARQIEVAYTRAQDALGQLGAAQRRYLGANLPAGQLPAAQLGASIAEAGRQLVAANENYDRTTRALAALDRQINALPASVRVAAQRAVEGLAGFNDGLNTTQTRISGIADSLNRLRNELLAWGINPQALQPLAPGQAGPQAPRPAAPGNAAGGLLGNVFTSRGPDDMLIAARRGEYIVNPASTRRFYPQLVAINAGTFGGYAQGGLVSNTTNVGDISIKVDGSGSPEETARTVMAKIRREIRRGN